MQTLTTKVMILGAGAGGFGAAYVLTQNKIPIIIADKNSGFGGNAVYNGVSCFEPGVSLDGVHSKLAEILLSNGGGEVQKTVPNHLLFREDDPLNKERPNPPYPWGLSVKCEDDYASTLKRCRAFGKYPDDCRRFMTDEVALGAAMDQLIDKRYCTTFWGYSYVCCEKEGRRISSVILTNGTQQVKISADFFLDCTGSIVFARDAGCAFAVGDDSGNLSGINGVSFVFRVSKRSDASLLPVEDLTEDINWTRTRMKQCVSCFNMYPNGDINVNMLPTLTGEEWLRLGKDAIAIGHSRVFHYWKYMQRTYRLEDYRIIKIFQPGIREDYHLVGRQVLTLEDIRAPFDCAKPFVAIGDHSIDIHGVKDMVMGELEHPYGIPLDCTVAQEFDNLYVACRGASFTHIAASTARLTRTMMSMGEGVAKHISSLIELSN